MGIHRKTNQYLVFDAERGTRSARTIMRFPDELKFDVAMAQAVRATPASSHDSAPHDAAFREPILRQDPIPVNERTKTLREMYVRSKDIDKFGYTPGCPRCDHIIQYGPNRTNITHSQERRVRIRACLQDTPEGRRRIAEWEERSHHQMAEEVHRGDDRLVEAPAAQGEIAEDGRAEPPLKFPTDQLQHRRHFKTYQRVHSHELSQRLVTTTDYLHPWGRFLVKSRSTTMRALARSRCTAR